MSIRTPTDLLAEIKAATSLGEIGLAKRLGVSQPTVNRILNGAGCNSKALLAIQQLHAEVVAPPDPTPEQAAA